MASCGLTPSNKMQGYILRRLIRRAAVHSKIANIDLEKGTLSLVISQFVDSYGDTYDFLRKNRSQTTAVIEAELGRFNQTLEKGLKLIGKISSFDLYQTYGFPPEVAEELMKQQGLNFDREEFEREKEKHQEKSRTASKDMFKGGLADQSDTTTKYHTATHLLHAALRQILGAHVQQRGSNITADRLRFDFSHPEKLSEEEVELVERLVNQKINEDIRVERLEMDKVAALAMGALALFPQKYPDKTSVYRIRDFSLELCGGPHVQTTSEIGRIKLTRQEQIGAGTQRVYAAISEKK